MTLFTHHFKTEWKSVLVWSLIMGFFSLFMVYMWEMFRESGSLADMEAMMATLPPVMQEMYGGLGDLTTLKGWIQMYSFGGWLHLPILIFTGLYVTGLITREVDRRTIEFLLAQPVARWQVLLSRWFSLLFALVLFHGAMLLGTVAGVLAIGHTPDTGLYLVAELNSVLLYMAIGGVLLALTIFINDYGMGLAVTLGLGLGSYMLNSAGAGSSGFLNDVRGWLPYKLFSPANVVGAGEFPAGDLAILGGVALGALALSIWLFQRKQISV